MTAVTREERTQARIHLFLTSCALATEMCIKPSTTAINNMNVVALERRSLPKKAMVGTETSLLPYLWESRL